jgi:hypothetical protein
MLHSTIDLSNVPKSVMKIVLGEDGRGTNKEGIEDSAMQME